MNTQKTWKRLTFAFFFALMIMLTATPETSARAAAKYGQVTAKWAKSGKYRFQLKKNGTLVYKVGSGKEKTVAKKVTSARFHGSKLAYMKKFSYDDEGVNSITPCVIYNCATRKTEKSAKIKGRFLEPNSIAGFYGNQVVISAGMSEALLLCPVGQGDVRLVPVV